MRVSINIPDEQINNLVALCKVKKLSRSEVIRQAIELYIEQNKPDAFGLLQNCKVDGLAYQEHMRSEW
jgi:metal-responsive CopG/Arc/MetJ family transcriptional regulator